MATTNLDRIIQAGLIMAFILPVMAMVSVTLPSPVVQPGGINVTQQLNSTGVTIYTLIARSYFNTSNTLLGVNCGPPAPIGIPGANSMTAPNCTGSLSKTPVAVQAFAFILDNLGSIVTGIVQLPYVDYLSLNLMATGIGTVMPGVPLSFLSLGADLLYLYMGFSLILMAVGLVQKYNPKVG